MSVIVTRISFYNATVAGQQHLNYREHSPEKQCKDHSICNCTKVVCTQPEDKPSRITQTISIEEKISVFDSEFDISRLWFTFLWGEVYTDKGLLDPDDDFNPKKQRNHAYFIFGQNKVKMEIHIANYGNVNYCFINLYRGNKVDISCFMNGWMPSRIVDLNKIKGTDFWLHDCNFGKEAIRFLYSENTKTEYSEEADRWNDIFNLVESIKQKSEIYNLDYTSNVYNLREKVESDVDLLKKLDSLRELLSYIVINIRSTELFKLSDEIRRNKKIKIRQNLHQMKNTMLYKFYIEHETGLQNRTEDVIIAENALEAISHSY